MICTGTLCKADSYQNKQSFEHHNNYLKIKFKKTQHGGQVVNKAIQEVFKQATFFAYFDINYTKFGDAFQRHPMYFITLYFICLVIKNIFIMIVKKNINIIKILFSENMF